MFWPISAGVLLVSDDNSISQTVAREISGVRSKYDIMVADNERSEKVCE